MLGVGLVSAFQIESVYRSSTRRIVLNNEVVGHLYAAHPEGGSWEIWPREGCAGLFAGWGRYEQAKRFAHEADALAFLGIQPEAVAA